MSKWIDYLDKKVSYALTKPLEKDEEYIATINKTDNIPASVLLDDTLIGETSDNTLTFTSPSSGYSTISFATDTEMDIEWVQLKKGNVATDWTPAPEDMLGKADFTIFKNDYDETAKSVERRLTAIDSSEEGSVVTRLNKTEKTASGNTTTISDIKTKPGEHITGYQTILERSNLYERVIGSSSEDSVKQSVARIVMTDSAFKVDVADKLNAISTYSKIYSVNTANPQYITDLNGDNLDPEKSYDITLGVLKTGTVTHFVCSLLPNHNGSWKLTVHSQSGTNSNHPYVEIAPNGQPRVRLYDHATFYSVEVTISEVGSRNKSALTMLSDNINLKVSKDDLISQINVQAGGVLITSGTNKLNVTPTTTYIENGTIKSAMIESLEAGKIKTGTLDAGKVKVINIDAENITSNKTSFIQSNWNDISSSIRIDAGGLLSTASDGSQVYLQNGIVGVRNPAGATIGQIGYVYDGGSPTYTIRTTWGSHFGLKQVFYDNFTKGTKEKRVMYASTADDGETTVQFYANSFILHQRKINFGFAHYIDGADSNLSITGQKSITLRANESTIFIVSNDGTSNFATLHSNLNMAGNTVTNTSDIRLKRDIVNDEIDSLSALMKWQHAGFNYINPDMNQDRQYGVIAQSAPDLSSIGEDGYLQVSLNKQVNMTSHALQQHVIKTNDEIAKLKAQVANLQDELAQLKGA